MRRAHHALRRELDRDGQCFFVHNSIYDLHLLARRIQELVAMLVERRMPAVFAESSVPDRNVRALIEGAAARGHAVALGGELFSDAMGEPGTYEGTYVGMIDHNVTIIARALGGTAPERGFQNRLGTRR